MGAHSRFIRDVCSSGLPGSTKAMFLAAAHTMEQYRKQQRFAQRLREEKRKAEEVRKRGSPLLRVRNLDDIDRLTDAQFRLMFRFTRPVFNEVLAKITPYLPSNEMRASYTVKGKRGSLISPRVRLLATLRWLSGGMMWDICLVFKIGFGSFFGESGVIWPTIAALDNEYFIGLPLDDPAALARTAQGFANMTPASAEVFTGVVSAIDGLAIQTRKPGRKEVFDITNWRNRKGFFGFVVLAGCDHRGAFNMWSTTASGSANDIECWHFCENKRLLQERRLPAQYYFIGDEAFVCEDQFLTPWGGQRIGHRKDAFNYHLSARRQTIERAFGMLTKRFGIFNRPFTFKYKKWLLVARVCAKLHNICIEKQVAEPRRWVPEHPDDAWNVYLNDVNYPLDEDDYATNGLGGARRRLMSDELERKGVRRPAFSMHKSRAE